MKHLSILPFVLFSTSTKFFSPDSILIESREQLEQFKSGLIGQGAEYVEVDESAKCTRDDVKSLYEGRMLSVNLRDEHLNVFNVSPQLRTAGVFVQHGEAQLADLPQGLTEYTANFGKDAIVSDDDIKTIVQWLTVANKVIIKGGGHNVATRLSQQLANVKSPKVQQIILTVDRQSYKQFDTAPFLKAFRRTGMIVFEAADDMTPSEFEEFVNNQKNSNFHAKSHNYPHLSFRRIMGY